MENFPITPVGEWIATKIIDKGSKISAGGIIVLDDNMKQSGIRPRWAKVLAVGPDVDPRDNINVGDFLLLEHLGWVRGMEIEVDGTEQTVHWTIPEKIVLIGDDLDETNLPTVEGVQ